MSKWKRFWNLGYDKDVITKVRSDMDKDNIIMVRNVNILLIIIIIILLLFYTLFDNNFSRNIVCSVSIALLIILLIISNNTLKNSTKITPEKTDLLINALSFLCFTVGIYLGTFAAPNDMAVPTIWMFFFAVLIFNRLPAQNILVLGISGIIFFVCSFALKGSHHFQYDVMHGVTSIIASIYMSWYKSKQKLENILALHRLKDVNLAIMETVEEQEKEAVHLRYRAEYDELSGFYKKASFEKMIMDILNTAKEDQTHILICSDIDNFKNINDSFGHLYGDEVLKEIVQNIVTEIGNDSIYGRFGGDEFLAFMKDVTDMSEFLTRISCLEKSCNKTYMKHGIERQVSLSVGYAIFPKDGNTYKKLFERADAKLYEEKKRKKLEKQ